jgi:hypothetical protein
MRLRSERGRGEHGTLSYSRRATDRPFTVIVCAACVGDRSLSVIDELRPTIGRCPHGMLVSAECLLGSLSCASRPTGYGVMAVLQPCTKDRVAFGPPHWIGPITNKFDAAVLRDWLESGQWETTPLPTQLCGYQQWAGRASLRNWGIATPLTAGAVRSSAVRVRGR